MICLPLDFLADRPPGGEVGRTHPSTLSLNTGAPKGCVFSSLLCSLYTHNYVATFVSSHQVCWRHSFGHLRCLRKLRVSSKVLNFYSCTIKSSWWGTLLPGREPHRTGTQGPAKSGSFDWAYNRRYSTLPKDTPGAARLGESWGNDSKLCIDFFFKAFLEVFMTSLLCDAWCNNLDLFFVFRV